jgi:hypothetical protein
MLLWTSLWSCGAPSVPRVVLVEEADVDTDVDGDADPMCSAYGPPVAWVEEPARWDGRAIVRMRPDWDCSSYSAELRVLCDDPKLGLPVRGADAQWYLSGALTRWTGPVLEQLRALPPEAFVASTP